MKSLPTFAHANFPTAFSALITGKVFTGFKIIHLPGSEVSEHTWGFFLFIHSGGMVYNKPPLTYAQQIALLESRGLIIADKPRAQKYLEHISYYRLSAYMLPYQQVKDTFNAGTTFDQILMLYRFDKQLRLTIFDAIERIEVAIRTQMIYQLSHKYNNAHWQDDASIFKAPFTNKWGKTIHVFNDIQVVIRKNCEAKRPEVFVEHYIDTYTSPKNPPSWMCLELLTIGELSRLFTALKHNDDKRNIANYFGVHHSVFESWLHTITYARNLCAHHARIWNRDFAIAPDLLLKPRHPWMNVSFSGNNHRCFYFICILKYLLHSANPSSHFTEKLADLFEKYPDTPIQFLGIPSDGKGNLIDWQKEPLWQ